MVKVGGGVVQGPATSEVTMHMHLTLNQPPVFPVHSTKDVGGLFALLGIFPVRLLPFSLLPFRLL